MIRTATDTTASADYADLLAVCEPSGKVRSYRGSIRAVNGTVGENRTVNDVPLEQYLRPVVATEMSASWATKGGGQGAQALQAQAVAARSYGVAENKFSYAKTCDDNCQAYFGAAWRSSVGGAYVRVEQTATDAAVAATAGVVRRVGSVNGAVAYTMFSASSGGWTAASTLGFPAVEDLGDATALNPYHTWSVDVTASTISAAWPSIGAYTGISVTERTGGGEWGGRVVWMVVVGHERARSRSAATRSAARWDCARTGSTSAGARRRPRRRRRRPRRRRRTPRRRRRRPHRRRPCPRDDAVAPSAVRVARPAADHERRRAGRARGPAAGDESRSPRRHARGHRQRRRDPRHWLHDRRHARRSPPARLRWRSTSPPSTPRRTGSSRRIRAASTVR